MSRLRLTYGGLLYLDRTLPLYTGDVKPSGVDLTYVAFDSPGDLFRRQIQFGEFDVSELSASSYIAMVSRGDTRLVGLPIFVSRNFRHSQIYVNAKAGISEPADLRGKRVGVYEYQMTAALWIRSLLERDYHVKPESLDWHTGGLISPVWIERMHIDLPPGIRLTQIGPDQTLEQMLWDGELDALVTMQPPQRFTPDNDRIGRLFPDHEQVERDYFTRTGVFPIMHLVAVRRDVYEANRWLPLTLLNAFEEAKARGMARMRATTGLAVGLPWLSASLAGVDSIFGGDAFPYGVEANRPVLDMMVTDAHAQGLAARLVDIDELFAVETLQGSVNF